EWSYTNATRYVHAVRIRRIWRYRWPLVITASLVMTAVFSLPALVDAAHPDAVVLATLRRPVAYYLLAPVSNVLDTLTILTPTQYWSEFATCAVAFLFLCAARHARTRNGFTALKA